MPMVLIEDTRQKDGKHNNIKKYCDTNSITIRREKLDVGDYVLDGFPQIVVDTKQDLCELCLDFGKEYARFKREMELAQRRGINLIFLVENANRYKTIADVAKWKNPNHAKKALVMNGRELMLRMYRAKLAYGVDFRFCPSYATGKVLLDILMERRMTEWKDMF